MSCFIGIYLVRKLKVKFSVRCLGILTSQQLRSEFMKAFWIPEELTRLKKT